MIIGGDLTPLYEIDISDCYAGVIKDMLGMAVKHHERLGQSSYFNSGVMLLNLKAMRSRNLTSVLKEYRLSHVSQFMDQDAFNAVFCEQVRYLSPDFNLMYSNLDFSLEEIASLLSTSIGRNAQNIVAAYNSSSNK